MRTLCQRRSAVFAFLLVFATCLPAFAGVVSVRVLDASGAPIKDALVIVQDLRARDSDEVFRALTDADGRVPSRDLPTGVYRVISTTPYGLWMTDVREVSVGAEAIKIVPMLKAEPTHGYGDVAILPEVRLAVRITRRDGSPVARATIMLRDRDATFATRSWATTDESGRTAIRASGSELVITVVTGGKLITWLLTERDLEHPDGVTLVLP